MRCIYIAGGQSSTLDHRLDGLGAKVDRVREELAGRIVALNAKGDSRFGALDQKISRNFVWTVGIRVAVLLAVVAALA